MGRAAAGARGALRAIDSGARSTNAVDRLYRFQGQYPEVGFTAPHMGGKGRYIARIPAGTLSRDPRELTLTSADLTGLMDQLDDLLPPEEADPDPRPV
jgi:hypothetical protein